MIIKSNAHQAFYTKTKDAWDALLFDIERAKKSVLLNNYIVSGLGEGQIGRRVVEALRRAKERGVRVELVLDAFGSLELWRKAKLFLHGFDVRFYNETPQWKHRFLNMLFRDHRKLCVIDGRITHIGGVVLHPATEGWDDFQARIEDDTVGEEAERAFAHHKQKLLERKVSRLKTRYFLAHDFDFKRGQIYQAIMKQLKIAKHEALFHTPYLSLPYLFTRKLQRAIRRGVKVTFILPATSNSRFASIVARRQVDKLLDIGAEVWIEPFMNHAKVAVIDGWTTFGSCNFDRLSLLYNDELNIQLSDKRALDAVKTAFSNWMSVSTKAQGRQASLGDRFIAKFTKYFV